MCQWLDENNKQGDCGRDRENVPAQKEEEDFYSFSWCLTRTLDRRATASMVSGGSARLCPYL